MDFMRLTLNYNGFCRGMIKTQMEEFLMLNLSQKSYLKAPIKDEPRRNLKLDLEMCKMNNSATWLMIYYIIKKLLFKIILG